MRMPTGPLGHPRRGCGHRIGHRDRQERRRPGWREARERAEAGAQHGTDHGRRRQADRRPRHGHPGEGDGEHAVGRDDVAGPEQHDVRDTDHDQPQPAPPDEADHGLRLHPHRRTACRELAQPVAEQQPEQGVGPAVDQGELQYGDHRVGPREPGGVAAHPERPVEQVQVHVRQRDEQQHDAAGHVRCERPVAQGHRTGRGVSGAGHGRDSRTPHPGDLALGIGSGDARLGPPRREGDNLVSCLRRLRLPSPSPSPEPPGRSATRCCSGSPPASCSGRTPRCACACWRSRRR